MDKGLASLGISKIHPDEQSGKVLCFGVINFQLIESWRKYERKIPKTDPVSAMRSTSGVAQSATVCARE